MLYYYTWSDLAGISNAYVFNISLMLSYGYTWSYTEQVLLLQSFGGKGHVFMNIPNTLQLVEEIERIYKCRIT